MSLSKSTILAFLATTTGFSIITSAYSFYYVTVFMNLYHIEEKWFHLAQFMFLIWNAVNDPLFAYIQDSTNLKCTKTRRESVQYTGPLFAVSFLLPWIPWGDRSALVGVHLVVALFIWDTLFTFVGLAMCGLFTELSHDSADRVALTQYQQIGYLIGSSSVMLLEYTSDSLHDYQAFQITAVFISVCSVVLFCYAGQNAHTEYDLKQLKDLDKDIEVTHNKTMNESWWKQTKQILSDRNFVSFVIANFCQEFHRTFLNNFMAILCNQLVSSQDVPKEIRQMFYGGICIMPQVLVILGKPLILHYSYYHVIRASYIYKVVAGVCMFFIGPNHPWVLMVFLMFDSCLTNASYALINLPLSDIVYTNLVKYNRKHPISSMVFGTNALIVKPAISLSPMLVVTILNRYGYSEIKTQSADSSTKEVKEVMFLLVCCFPCAIGIVQFVSWSFFAYQGRSKQIRIDV